MHVAERAASAARSFGNHHVFVLKQTGPTAAMFPNARSWPRLRFPRPSVRPVPAPDTRQRRVDSRRGGTGTRRPWPARRIRRPSSGIVRPSSPGAKRVVHHAFLRCSSAGRPQPGSLVGAPNAGIGPVRGRPTTPTTKMVAGPSFGGSAKGRRVDFRGRRPQRVCSSRGTPPLEMDGAPAAIQIRTAPNAIAAPTKRPMNMPSSPLWGQPLQSSFVPRTHTDLTPKALTRSPGTPD
jgi:hypothetical protein